MSLRILTIALLLSVISSNLEAAPAIFPFLAQVNTDNVNIRAGQSANFEKIGQLHKGEGVVVVEKNFSWYKIRLPKIANSFISDKYIKLRDNGLKGEVMADRVNVRAGANVNATSLGQLPKGAQVVILEKTQGWYKIEPVDDSYGWIAEEFLDFQSNDISQYVSQAPTPKINPSVELIPLQAKNEAPHTMLTVIGFLEPFSGANAKAGTYQLTIEGHPTYQLEGMTDFINRFVYYKVSVEGHLKTNAEPNQILPTIVVHKLKLIL